MSRRRKLSHPYGQATSPVAGPPPLPQPPQARNGATPPHDDPRAQVVALRALIEETRRELNARLDALADAVGRLAPEHDAPALPWAEPTAVAPVVRDIRVGDEVYVPRLGGTHTVVAVSSSGDTFKVQAGTMRVQVRRDEMWALDDGRRKPDTAASAWAGRPYLCPDIPEIDLHGFSERDALITLELFLHHAFAQRTPRVRVIHGKGNGVLRAAVRRALAGSGLVRGIDAGPEFRGDEGVTLADLDL